MFEYMLRSGYLIVVVLLFISCGHSSMDESLAGKWKIVKFEYSNPNMDTDSLGLSEYNIGRVIEFKTSDSTGTDGDSVKWEESGKFQWLNIHERDSLLLFKNGQSNILKLNSSELVLQELLSGKELNTYCRKID